MGIVDFKKIKILICDEHGNGAIRTLEDLHQLVDDLITNDEFREVYKEFMLNKEWYFYND